MSATFRFLLPLVALCALASSALAGEGKVVITVDRPVAVLLDGELLEFEDGTTAVERSFLEPGIHLVEFRNLVGRLVGEGRIEVPPGPSVVRARWAGKSFEVYDTVLLQPREQEVVVIERTTTVVDPGHDGVRVSAHAGGYEAGASASISVDASVSVDGAFGTGVVVQAHESHAHTETVIVEHGAHPADVVVVETVETVTTPASRRVVFRVTDDESVNLWIDGKREWAYHVGSAEKSLELPTGEHRVELKDFMENETWCSGQLFVDGYQDLVVGISKDGCVEVFTDSTAFRRAR